MENQTTSRNNPIAQALADVRAHCPELCKRVPEGELALALAMFRALDADGRQLILKASRAMVAAQNGTEGGEKS